MGIRVLPTTLRGKLTLAGAFALTSVFVSAIYMGFGNIPYLVQQPNHGVELPLENTKPPLKNDTLVVKPNATIGDVGAVNNKPRILLVSAMFPLPKTKYPQTQYNEWIKNYLDTVTTDIYLYTTPELGPQFQALRHAGLTITVDTTYISAFEIPPLKGKENRYELIQKKDRVHRGRNVNMTQNYAIHNAKPFFLHSALQTMKSNGQEYEYAFWNAPTSFKYKEHEYREWPFPDKVQEVWKEGSQLSGTKEDDLIFVPIFDMPHITMSSWSEMLGPIDNKFSEGMYILVFKILVPIDIISRVVQAHSSEAHQKQLTGLRGLSTPITTTTFP